MSGCAPYGRGPFRLRAEKEGSMLICGDRDLARRLRVALAEADVRPAEFASLAGLSKTHLSRLLHAKVPIGELARIKVDRALAKLAEEREEVSA